MIDIHVHMSDVQNPLFIFSKRVAVRASGVSQNVVGVSPRKLF